jgi:hypothetical protein
VIDRAIRQGVVLDGVRTRRRSSRGRGAGRWSTAGPTTPTGAASWCSSPSRAGWVHAGLAPRGAGVDPALAAGLGADAARLRELLDRVHDLLGG